MTFDPKNKILIFTDGACSGNPGPGGYGSIIVYPDGKVKELGGKASPTTNNQMEIRAVTKALDWIHREDSDVWVLTDSTYVIRGITQWIWGWKKKGWKTAEGNGVSNQDEWQNLERAVAGRSKKGKLEWKYLRGHSDIPGNERADEIAVHFSKGKFIDLFDGPLIEYDVPIFDLPDKFEMPPMKSSGEKKKKAHSYLSYVNGVLKRHSNWKDCEAVVKGRAGAKFKKAMSPDDESKIAKSWGTDISKAK